MEYQSNTDYKSSSFYKKKGYVRTNKQTNSTFINIDITIFRNIYFKYLRFFHLDQNADAAIICNQPKADG